MRLLKQWSAWLTVAMLTLAMLSMTAFAAEGKVDWNKGVIRATGIGTGKSDFKDKNPGVYRAQAKRAAMMDSRFCLLP